MVIRGHAVTGQGPGTWGQALLTLTHCEGHLPLKLRLKEETNFRLDFLLLGYF